MTQRIEYWKQSPELFKKFVELSTALNAFHDRGVDS